MSDVNKTLKEMSTLSPVSVYFVFILPSWVSSVSRCLSVSRLSVSGPDKEVCVTVSRLTEDRGRGADLFHLLILLLLSRSHPDEQTNNLPHALTVYQTHTHRKPGLHANTYAFSHQREQHTLGLSVSWGRQSIHCHTPTQTDPLKQARTHTQTNTQVRPHVNRSGARGAGGGGGGSWMPPEPSCFPLRPWHCIKEDVFKLLLLLFCVFFSTRHTCFTSTTL